MDFLFDSFLAYSRAVHPMLILHNDSKVPGIVLVQNSLQCEIEAKDFIKPLSQMLWALLRGTMTAAAMVGSRMVSKPRRPCTGVAPALVPV